MPDRRRATNVKARANFQLSNTMENRDAVRHDRIQGGSHPEDVEWVTASALALEPVSVAAGIVRASCTGGCSGWRCSAWAAIS